jgi:hypothetical protein
MANVLGSIQINITAGTATFVSDLEKANAVAKRLSAEMKQSMQRDIKESNASLALFGEEFGVRLPRHVRTFVSSLPGVSSAMSAAFGGLAVFAIGATLFEAGKKAYELAKAFDASGEAAKKNSDVWRGLQLDQQRTNTQIDLTNAKLEAEIAKLEHKPANGLKVTLLEAQAAAEALYSSLRKVTEEEIKALKDQDAGWVKRIITGEQSNKDVQELLKDYDRRAASITATGAAGTSHDAGATQTTTMLALQANKLREIADLQEKLNSATKTNQDTYSAGLKPSNSAFARQQMLEGQIAQQRRELQQIQGEVTHEGLQARVNELRDKNANAAPVSPVTGALAMAQAQYDNSLKMLAVSKEIPIERAKQLALDKADLEIARLQKEIADHNAKPGAKPMAAMSAADQQKLRNTTLATEENTLATKLNETLADGTRVTALRTTQERALALAVTRGAEAVQRANAQAQAENELKKQGATASQIAARAEEILTESKAKAHTTATQDIQDKSYELAAQQRLTAAYLQGAEALRQAELQNKIAAINRSGAPPADKSTQISQATLQSQQQLQENIARAAGQAANADKDRITFLQQTLSVLKTMDQTAPEVSAAIKQTSKELVELQGKMAMATGAPMAGLKTFFNEMAVSTRTAAQDVNDLLGKAFNDLNDQMAKALLGQKTNWKGFFQGMATSTAKSAMKQGEGAITKALGFGKDATKRGNTPMNPLYVSVVGGMSGMGSGASDVAGGGLLHSLGIPGFASGGDPSPYGLSIVGENGPELHSNLGGHVASNKDLMQMLGGQHFHIGNIDARGTNAAEVEMRVRRAIAESHVASVHSSVAAQRELQARRPPKTKGAY